MTPLAGPAFVVVGVLVVAGGAKAWRPSPTATALRELRIPAPLVAARTMGIAEIAIGLIAVVSGRPEAWALVAIAYGAFAVFVLWALGSSAPVGSCGCFGHEDTPPTPGHAAFNAAAAAVAALAVAERVRVGDLEVGAAEGVLLVALLAVAVYVCVLSLTALPRTLALASGTAPTPTPEFAIVDRREERP